MTGPSESDWTLPSIRLGDFHPFHRLRFIGPTQQLFPDGQKIAIIGEFIHGYAVDPCATLIGLDPPHCFLQVFPLTYFLHYSIRVGRAFVFIERRERFGLSSSRFL